MGFVEEQAARSQVLRVASGELQRCRQSASRSSVPTAIVRGPDFVVHYANPAFAQFLGLDCGQLDGLPLESLAREPDRLEALIARACANGCAELASDCAYACPTGTCFGATLVQPLFDDSEQTALLQIVDTTKLVHSRTEAAQAAVELRLANERLLLASLREHDLAEQAAAANGEIARLLQRKSVMAEINTLLSSSLELQQTLQQVAALCLPDLADCCVVQLAGDGAPGEVAAVHNDPDADARLKNELSELRTDPHLALLLAEVKQAHKPCVRSLLEPSTPKHAGEASALRRAGVRSALAIPLQARGAVIGVLSLCRCEGSADFAPLNIEFALEVARRASVAIDNAQLYAEAQRAVRLRDDVLAIVSHDLRNPLGAIRMVVQRLLKNRPQDDSESSRALALIMRSSRHMQRLIEELLDVANIQKGALVLRLADVPFEDSIAEAAEMFEGTAKQKGVQLVRQSLGDLGLVRCDAERIVRAVANLIGNAVKFTKSGGKVTVVSERTADAVRVMVHDTGPGISAHDRTKLFEQYWKGSGTGRSGIGLGLYIARSVAEAHGGRVSVESEQGVGSTFTLCIPQ